MPWFPKSILTWQFWTRKELNFKFEFRCSKRGTCIVNIIKLVVERKDSYSLYLFFNVGPPKEDIFLDHLLWSIFQSVLYSRHINSKVHENKTYYSWWTVIVEEGRLDILVSSPGAFNKHPNIHALLYFIKFVGRIYGYNTRLWAYYSFFSEL